MNDLMVIGGVRGYIDETGTAQLNLEDVSRGLGFTQIAKSGNEVVRWERVNQYLKDFGFMPTDENTKINTLAAHKTDGYDDDLTEEEQRAVRAFIDTYRKQLKKNKDE